MLLKAQDAFDMIKTEEKTVPYDNALTLTMDILNAIQTRNEDELKILPFQTDRDRIMFAILFDVNSGIGLVFSGLLDAVDEIDGRYKTRAVRERRKGH